MLVKKLYKHKEENIIYKIREKWFNISDKIRFLLVGGFNAGVSYIIFSILCLIIGEQYYQIALALSWIISSVVSFTTQRCFVFNVSGNLFRQYIKCCTTWVFSYLINAFLLSILVQKVLLNVYISQIIATLACAVFTYTMFKIFAFRRK